MPDHRDVVATRILRAADRRWRFQELKECLQRRAKILALPHGVQEQVLNHHAFHRFKARRYVLGVGVGLENVLALDVGAFEGWHSYAATLTGFLYRSSLAMIAHAIRAILLAIGHVVLLPFDAGLYVDGGISFTLCPNACNCRDQSWDVAQASIPTTQDGDFELPISDGLGISTRNFTDVPGAEGP